MQDMPDNASFQRRGERDFLRRLGGLAGVRHFGGVSNVQDMR
jgi:hypothetical protein